MQLIHFRWATMTYSLLYLDSISDMDVSRETCKPNCKTSLPTALQERSKQRTIQPFRDNVSNNSRTIQHAIDRIHSQGYVYISLTRSRRNLLTVLHSCLPLSKARSRLYHRPDWPNLPLRSPTIRLSPQRSHRTLQRPQARLVSRQMHRSS